MTKQGEDGGAKVEAWMREAAEEIRRLCIQQAGYLNAALTAEIIASCAPAPTPAALEKSRVWHMYVWTKQPFFHAVAQAENVDEARNLLLEEIGSGDGSCPEREKAAEWVRTMQPTIFHRSNAEFSLTDSAELSEQEAYVETLQKKIKELQKATPAPSESADVKEVDLCRPHAETWFCERNHLADSVCVVCAFLQTWAAIIDKLSDAECSHGHIYTAKVLQETVAHKMRRSTQGEYTLPDEALASRSVLQVAPSESADWLVIAAAICLKCDIEHEGKQVLPGELAQFMQDTHGTREPASRSVPPIDPDVLDLLNQYRTAVNRLNPQASDDSALLNTLAVLPADRVVGGVPGTPTEKVRLAHTDECLDQHEDGQLDCICGAVQEQRGVPGTVEEERNELKAHLSQALRQWRMYADGNDGRDLETCPSEEGQIYRANPTCKHRYFTKIANMSLDGELVYRCTDTCCKYFVVALTPYQIEAVEPAKET